MEVSSRIAQRQTSRKVDSNFYEKALFVKGRRGGSVIVAERNSLGPSRYASIRTSEEPHAFQWLGAFDEIRLLGLLKALQSS